MATVNAINSLPRSSKINYPLLIGSLNKHIDNRAQYGHLVYIYDSRFLVYFDGYYLEVKRADVTIFPTPAKWY